jgi:DNA repair exonuclease SbcCD ATPase subunit
METQVSTEKLENLSENLSENYLELTLEELSELWNWSLENSINIWTESSEDWSLIQDIGITSKQAPNCFIKTPLYKLNCHIEQLIWANTNLQNTENWYKASDLTPGMQILTRIGWQTVLENTTNTQLIDLWDIQVSTGKYLANGIMAHNSTIQDILDFNLFKKVKGKRREWATIGTLPNRINGGLWTQLVLEKPLGDSFEEIQVTRGASPTLLEVSKSGVSKDLSKALLDNQIIDWMGMDIAAFKTFVSVNANDFKNFIYMSPKDKRAILDKIFNLHLINEITDIVKAMSKKTLEECRGLEGAIRAYQYSLQTLEENLIQKNTQETINNEARLKEIEDQLNTLLEDFLKIKEDGRLIESQISTTVSQWQSIDREISAKGATIVHLKQKMDLLKSGYCPQCESTLDESHKKTMLSKIKSEGKTIVEEQTNLTNTQLALAKIKEEAILKQSEITTNYRWLQNSIESLKSEKRSLEIKPQKDPTNSEDLSKLKNQLDLSKTQLAEQGSSLEVINRLIEILQDDSLKSKILEGVIEPLNWYLAAILPQLGCRYSVQLNEHFDAKLLENGIEIDPDTLSEGEDKRINIGVMFAYLNMIRKNNQVNLLFIDEVFSYIDTDGITMIIEFLRKWASENKTNVIIVNHYIPTDTRWDRLWTVERGVYSYLLQKTL